MRYLLFVLALLSGISFGAVAYGGNGEAGNGNDANGKHRGDCESDANKDGGFNSSYCDDPSQY